MESRPTDALRGVGWEPTDAPTPMEIVSFSSLLERFPQDLIGKREQVGFDVVVIAVSGTADYMVDFDVVRLQPRRVVHLQPGQVHRWPDAPDLDLLLLLARQAPMSPRPWPTAAVIRDLDQQEWERFGRVLDAARDEMSTERSPAASSIARAAVRDLLFVSLGLVDVPASPSQRDGVFLAFRDDVERVLVAGESVESRAGRLGYSARTIDRACRAATGRSAKNVADTRLALEARRLLALPGSTAAGVARRLGFTEASNFTKFVTRTTGRTPSQWQKREGSTG